MPKYSVAIEVHATMYVEVEADSEEEARDKAENEANEPVLCYQCANEVEVHGIGDVIEVAELKK